MAASTHKEEEIFCIKVHLELKKIYDNVITIIAPRHIDRSMQIKTLAENFNLNVQLLNRDDSILQNSEIIANVIAIPADGPSFGTAASGQ